MTPRFAKVSETAHRLRVSVDAVCLWIRQGEIPSDWVIRTAGTVRGTKERHATFINCNRPTVTAWRRNRNGRPFYQIGRLSRYSPQDVAVFLNSKRRSRAEEDTKRRFMPSESDRASGAGQ